MSAQVQISLLDEGGLALHTGLTPAYTSKPSDGQWMKQELKKEQEASVTTQFEDNDGNAQVLQNKNRNGNKRVYDCSVCLKRFDAPSKLKRHCLIHTDQRPYQCSTCFRAFRERSHLKAHFRTHTNPSSPDAVTSAVSKSSDRLCTLQLKKKSGYQCEICLKKFSFPSKLTRHMFVHSDDKAYPCTICRKSFKQANYLHKHLKVHTGQINSNSGLCRVPQKHGAKSPTPGALGCMEAGGNVCLPQILDSLKNKMHEEPECQSKLSQNVPLTESNSSTVEIKSSNNTAVQIPTSRPIDLKRTHKGVNQCSICLKNFPYPSKLARHILSHTGIRPFKCHVCLKSFKFRWDLQCHVKIHKKKGRNIIAGHLEHNRSVSFSNAVKSEEQDVQISLQDGAEASATVHQRQNTVIENMINQKMISDCSDSDVYFQGRLDLLTVQSSGYFPKPPKGQWIEENQESTKEKETCITTQNEDKDVNVKVWQSMNFNGNKRVYDCPVCHKRFGAPSKLKRHCLIHTNQRPYQCSTCCRAFRERSHLTVHIRTHTNPVKSRTQSLQSYKDNSVHCNRTSNSRLKPYSKNETAQNDTCSTNKQKTTPADLIESNVGTMGVKVTKEHRCPLCLKCFKAPSKLRSHILIHTGQRPFKCSLCPKTFSEKSDLKVHKCTKDFSQQFNYILSDRQVKQNTVKHNTSEDVVSTTIDDSNDILGRCSSPDAVTTAEKKIFPVSKSSDRLCTLQLKKKSGYQCEICLKKFSFPSKLTRHMFVHSDDKAYPCTICRKSFKQANYLHKHLKVHTGQINSNSGLCRVPQKHGAKSPTPGALGCMEAGGNVCLPQILDSLKNKMHEEPEYQSKLSQNIPLTESNSSTVEIKSSNNTAVQIPTSRPIDLKRTHKGVNQCSICLKNFPYPSKLARHILSHTGIRPFKCHVCLKSFQFRWDLQCHVKIHKKKGRNIIAGHLEHNRSVSFSNAVKSEEQDVQISLQDGAEASATVHQHQNTVKENMINQKMMSDCSDSDVYFQGRLDLPTGQSSGYFPKPPKGQWIEENQESAKEKETCITTQNEDKDVNVKVWQSMNCNGNKRVYDCPVCHKRFGAPSKLKRHCLIHTNQRPYQIKSSNNTEVQIPTSRPIDLKRAHKGVNQCSICLKNFPYPCKLARHILSHTSIRPFKCHVCLKSFKFRWDLQCHVKIHKKKGRNIIAGHLEHNCSVSFSNAVKSEEQDVQISSQDGAEDSATVHQRQNTVIENMINQKMISDCRDSGVYLKDSLLEGLDLHTGQSYANSSKHSEGQWMEENQESEEGQEASVTTQSMDNDVTVKVSQSKIFNRSKRVYDCPVCHKRFGAPSKLKRHCLIHTNQRPYQCSTCCRAFRERSHLTVHMSTHTNQSLQRYKDISVPCNQIFNSKLKPSPKQTNAQDDTKSTDNLTKQNQQTEEEQEASITTQNKDNDANVKVWLSKNSDLSKRVYDCPVCHKRFGAPSKLKRHCLIHTNQRPFQCSTCCRAFRERSHLTVHLRTHTNPVKSRTQPLQRYIDNSVPCNHTSKSRLESSPRCLTVQYNASSTGQQQSTVHPKKTMIAENVASQIMSGDYSESDIYLQDSLLNKGVSSEYSSNPSEGQWMEEIQESEEEQEASVTTQTKNNDVNSEVWQSKNSNRSKKVYDCPVCHKRFGAPSKLKRHCLIHTNQRPYQCSTCCRAFRERSHLNVHMRTHNIPGKRRTPSLQSFKDKGVSCNQASKLKPSPKYITSHNDTMSTNKQKSTIKPDQNVRTEDVSSPFENVENKGVFPCNNNSVWVLMHASDIVPFGRVSDCPPKTDSSLHHCASESRAERKWAHHMDDIDCIFVDSGCAPDSYKPSSCQNQENPDVPGLPEVVVELEDFMDEGECFIKSPHDLPFCPDCKKSFHTIRNLYAHNCSNRYQEEEMKKSHQCDMCFKFFNAPSKLKRHYLTHTGQKPFQCTQCQKSFTQSHRLKTHMLSHW